MSSDDVPRTIIVSGDRRVPPRGIKYAKTTDDPEKVAGKIAILDSNGYAKLLSDPTSDKIYGIFAHQLQDVAYVDEQYNTAYAKDGKPVTVFQEDRLMVYGILDHSQSISEGDVLSVSSGGYLVKWDSSKPIIGIAMESATTDADSYEIIKFDFLGIHSNIQPFAYKETLSVSSDQATTTYYPLAITSVRASSGTVTGAFKLTDTTPGSGEVQWNPGSKTLTFNSADGVSECVVQYLCIKQ